MGGLIAFYFETYRWAATLYIVSDVSLELGSSP